MQITYIHGAYDAEEGFVRLNDEITAHEEAKCGKTCRTRRLFYLALPPSVYPLVSKKIREFCMNPREWFCNHCISQLFSLPLYFICPCTFDLLFLS